MYHQVCCSKGEFKVYQYIECTCTSLYVNNTKVYNQLLVIVTSLVTQGTIFTLLPLDNWLVPRNKAWSCVESRIFTIYFNPPSSHCELLVNETGSVDYNILTMARRCFAQWGITTAGTRVIRTLENGTTWGHCTLLSPILPSKVHTWRLIKGPLGRVWCIVGVKIC